MAHKGLEGVINDLKQLVEIQIVEYTIDHDHSDYTPFVRIVKEGGLTPEEVKSLNKRGMVIFSTLCSKCNCAYKDENGNEIPGVQVIAVTPIDKSVENRNMTKWIEEIKDALNLASQS